MILIYLKYHQNVRVANVRDANVQNIRKRIQSNLFSKHVRYWKNTITQTLHNCFKKSEKRFLDQKKLTFLKNTCKKLEETGIISVIDQPVYTSNIV